MAAIFEKVLEMSFSASWLVLAVLLIRFVLKRAPKWTRGILWAMVALRLLCPFSLESQFSLIPERTVEEPEILDDYIGDTNIYWDTSEEYHTAVDAGLKPQNGGEGHTYVVTGETPETEPAVLEDLLPWVWVCGMGGMLLYALISARKLKKRVAASLPLGENIYLCDYIETPFILGILRPKIYLPSAMEPNAASHVLAHERAHIRRRDHWWKPLGYLLLTIHWFNPLLWLAYVLLCRDIELACDEKVIREMGDADKKAYSEALLSCSVPRHMIAACPLAFGEVGVKERVKSVLNYKKPAFWILLLAIIALAVTAVCFLTDPVTGTIADLGAISDLEYDSITVSSGDSAIVISSSFAKQKVLRFLKNTQIAQEPISESRIEREGEYSITLGSTSIHFPADLSYVWINDGVKPSFPYLLENEADARNFFSDILGIVIPEVEPTEPAAEPFGRTYYVEEILYRNPLISYYITAQTAPVYDLTVDGCLSVLEDTDSGIWSNLGAFSSTELTQENFDDCIIYVDISWESEVIPAQLRQENRSAWYLRVNDPEVTSNSVFYYLLWQENGDVYLLQGSARGADRSATWVFRLGYAYSDTEGSDGDSPFGKYYRTNGVAYGGASRLSCGNVYLITAGYSLLELDSISANEAERLARFTPVELTAENFDAFFQLDPELGYSLRQKNAAAWEYHDTTSGSSLDHVFWYLLQQKDGSVYIATGIWWDAQYREGETVINSLHALEEIESDDPFLAADSPLQWTLNLDLKHMEQIQVTTRDENGGEKQVVLSQSETENFIGTLNTVTADQITQETAHAGELLRADVSCGGETVQLCYDGERVTLTFSGEAADRYPQEKNKVWTIRSAALNSFLRFYQLRGTSEDPYYDPSDPYRWCNNISSLYVGYGMVGFVTPEGRNGMYYLDGNKMTELLEIINSLPESAIQSAQSPESSFVNLTLASREEENAISSYWVTLDLVDGAVYYTCVGQSGTYRLEDERLEQLMESLYQPEAVTHYFVQLPDGNFQTGTYGDIQISVPMFNVFEYETTDTGTIRFRPVTQEEWISIQYYPEGFAACGTGLTTSTLYVAGYSAVEGYYDGSDVWSFIKVTTDYGDVVFLNESGAPWVREYTTEIHNILGGMELTGNNVDLNG